MKTLTFHDMEQLSAYLDGQLTQSERAHMDNHIKTDPNLSTALNELRQTRALLRLTPHHRIPRNFSLTPGMAGIRPPVPRIVPALRLASVLATFLLFLTFAGNFLSSFTMAAALKAALPGIGGGIGGGPAESVQATEAPALALPPSADNMVAATPTAGAAVMLAPKATLSIETAPEPSARMPEQPANMPPEQHALRFILNPFQIVLIALALVLCGAAFLIRWLRDHAFVKNIKRNL